MIDLRPSVSFLDETRMIVASDGNNIGKEKKKKKKEEEKIDELNRITSPSRSRWMVEARTEGKVRGEPRPELANKDDRELASVGGRRLDGGGNNAGNS